ncbi:MAG: hypothetical protein IPK79_01235 [Vampirovibrionales bacterium]|nr:hypothetical protein [Vampirovibrionales bacterium]
MRGGGPYAYTVLVNDTDPVACIGVSENGGKGMAWAFLARHSCRYWVTIHRGVWQFLRGVSRDREWPAIEAFVAVGHLEAHRWAVRLGFVPVDVGRVHIRYERAS